MDTSTGSAPLLSEICISPKVISKQKGFNYKFTLYANNDFKKSVLDPVLNLTNEIADTAELFVRSIQMYKFHDINVKTKKNVLMSKHDMEVDKVGIIANGELRKILQSGKVPKEEISLLMDKGYSLTEFGLGYSLLVRKDKEYDRKRYYSKPLNINGVEYVMTSQWYERNKERLIEWIENYKTV